jgi:hypothetical protein
MTNEQEVLLKRLYEARTGMDFENLSIREAKELLEKWINTDMNKTNIAKIGKIKDQLRSLLSQLHEIINKEDMNSGERECLDSVFTLLEEVDEELSTDF